MVTFKFINVFIKLPYFKGSAVSCPSCKSEEWKLASLVYSEGIQHVNTQTSGGGVGIGSGGIAVGAGGATTTGTHQSALSAAASPPEDPAKGIGFLISLVITLIFFIYGWLKNDALFPGFALAAVGFAGSIIISPIIAIIFTRKLHAEQMAAWHKVRMCLRCGTFYVPMENVAAEKNSLHSQEMQVNTIHDAVYEGNWSLVRQLLKEGVDVNQINPEGKTPLEIARERGDDLIIKLLISNGAN